MENIDQTKKNIDDTKKTYGNIWKMQRKNTQENIQEKKRNNTGNIGERSIRPSGYLLSKQNTN